MLKGISYWSMQHGLDGTHSIRQAIEDATSAGFDALELCIGTEGVLSTESSQGVCAEIQQQFRESGLRLETLASGISWKFNPVDDDAEVREHSVRLHDEALRRAAWLGCSDLLFVPGIACSPLTNSVVRYDLAIDRARRNLDRLLTTADEVGVTICIENVWNGMFYSPLELRDFIASFGSDQIGVYLDVGNLLGYHQYPPHWIELLGNFIRRVHVKDFSTKVGNVTGFCDLCKGDVPWDETFAALRRIGYDSTVVAEMIPWRKGLLEETSRAMDVNMFQAT
jgi:hexulose-6-phosphate isomerase